MSQRLAARSPASAAVADANRYAAFEFTEDPFRNYRYEDPFNIADPFSDEDNGNQADKGGGLDPFGMATSRSPSRDGDARFSRPLADDLFDDDFAQTECIQVGSKNKADRTAVLDDLSNNNSKSEKVDPFRVISEQKKAFGDVPSNKDSKKHCFWSKQSSGNNSLKKKSSLFSHKTLNGAGGALSEDQQLSWAARESLRLEEERKQRQAQENADLALALELSRREARGHN